MQADGQRLVIERSKLTDADIFTCIAANQAGSLEQDYDVDVWGKFYTYLERLM